LNGTVAVTFSSLVPWGPSVKLLSLMAQGQADWQVTVTFTGLLTDSTVVRFAMKLNVVLIAVLCAGAVQTMGADATVTFLVSLLLELPAQSVQLT
jgi:hypothetical protein